jgi:uncharacterized membrane protein YtjA (UPF0391 family)
MLRLALLFLVIALLAGIFFFLFIVLAVIFLLGGLFRGSRHDIV